MIDASTPADSPSGPPTTASPPSGHYYNTVVAELNRRIEAFSSNLVARRVGFGAADFFESQESSR